MRSVDKIDEKLLDATDRLSELSIVIEDFDSCKSNKTQECSTTTSETPIYQRPQRPYVRQSSDVSIRKILEEAENRKHEFWKLIDEHNAVIENLKKIEQLENSTQCKNTPQVSTSVST